MKKYTSKEVRKMWLDFFESKGHEVLPSKSLIPVNDPSLLWINSGVATLKDYFSGKKLPSNPKMTNSQKAIRTNDIENVGVTARHHTFFEMLGNFSIGDYFKEGAIKYAIEVLFDLFKFDKEKIYITYYEEDKETFDIWIKNGIDPSHLIKGNKEMNFWDVGQGPCGPDTEIFYDRGKKYDSSNKGIELIEKDLENDRYIEIWNIVFSQFNNDGEGNYTELTQKNIDTGAGLERIVSIFQDAPTNFDTDLFLPIIKEIEKLTDKKYDVNDFFEPKKEQTEVNKKFKIIADHMRAVVLAIQDGAKPSNTQRGYIIRRLIRRAYRSGIQLGIKRETFLYKLVDVISEIMDYFVINKELVTSIITKEEIAFSKTIKQGEEILSKELSTDVKELNPKIAFKLFETYGFPIELTEEIVNDKGIKLDISKFDKLREKHANASRGKKASAMDKQINVIQQVTDKLSNFVGYETTKMDSEIIFQSEENNKVYLLIKDTPFYATKGGQQFDKGTINGETVLDVFRDKFENHWHVLNNKVTDPVRAIVNQDIRTRKERNHSATHLLGLAITRVFGSTAIQLGSENDENRLRLDFPLDSKPTEEEIQLIEDGVNGLINESINRKYKKMKYNDAIEEGVIALEGEDYWEGELRVVEFGDSKEFCGGTHISNTKRIGKFKITKLESKGSGVFRIEAITSLDTVQEFEKKQISKLQNEVQTIINKNKKLDSKYEFEVESDIKKLKEQLLIIRKDNKELSKKAKQGININTDVEFVTYNGHKAFIDLAIDNPALVKPTAMAIKNAHQDALVIVGSVAGGKQTLAVASASMNAKEIFDNIASAHNGRGGGNERFAMGSMEEIWWIRCVK